MAKLNTLVAGLPKFNMSKTPGLPSLVDLAIPKLPPLSSIFTDKGPSKAMAALKKGNLGIGFSGSGAFLVVSWCFFWRAATAKRRRRARPTPPTPLTKKTPAPTHTQKNSKKIGFLLFYFIGVADALMKVGVITPGKTKIAAVSGGIISSAPQLGIVSTKDFRNKGYQFAAKCRANNNCMWTLDAEVKSLVRSMLPPTAYKNATDHGYITISVPTANGSINPMTVSKFKDNEDLVGAIAAGTYIPFCESFFLLGGGDNRLEATHNPKQTKHPHNTNTTNDKQLKNHRERAQHDDVVPQQARL